MKSPYSFLFFAYVSVYSGCVTISKNIQHLESKSGNKMILDKIDKQILKENDLIDRGDTLSFYDPGLR